MSAQFGDLKSAGGLTALNTFLLTRSYIDGFKPSQADVTIFSQLTAAVDEAKYGNVARWAKHIGSFTTCKRASWAGQKAAVAGAADEKKAAPAKAAAAAAEDDGDPFAEKEAKPERSPFEQDDDDMTEEEKETERIIAAKAKKLNDERAAKGKKKEAGRSTLILDVKPLGSETDMKELEAAVRAIVMDGLRWAGSELVPIGYGIKKLRIISVIVDDLVSTDVLREKIEAMEEQVQSTDIFAFNKV